MAGRYQLSYSGLNYKVLGVGLEPTSREAKDFKSFVYTIPPPEQYFKIPEA